MEVNKDDLFSSEVMDQVCPFYFILDEQNKIIKAGNGFFKVFPDIQPGAQFYNFFAVTDSADSLTQKVNKKAVCVVKHRPLGLSMKVNPISLQQNHVLYVGYPILTSGTSLRNYNLTINDLPQHDSIIEFLFILEGMKRSMSESEQYIQSLSTLNSKLKKNNKRFLQAQSVGKVGSWYWDLKEEAAEWSEMCCEIYCLPLTDNRHSYNEWLSFIHPEDLPIVKQQLEDAQLSKSSLELTCRIITRCGQLKYVQQNSAYDVDSNGQVIGIYGSVKDVTEQHEANCSLLAANKELERYKNAIDNSAIVSVTNARGVITHVNQRFCEVSKYSRNELIGKDHRLINSGHHTTDFIGEMWRTIKAGNIWKGEIKNKAKDGSFYWVESVIVPFLEESGKPWQYISIRHEITERKLAEQRIEFANRQLERKVRERTRELEQKNDELESFVYTVSHDLRSPLRMINSYATLVAEKSGGLLSPTHSEMLKNIKEYSVRMNSIITDLLNLSRIGSQPLQKQKFSLNDLVEVVVKEIKQEFTTNCAEVSLMNLGDLEADKGLLKQVFTNLISNAFKYTSKVNHAKIEVGKIVSGENQVVFFIKDNGAGFDAENAARLFKPFQRMHSKEEFDGNGVGLSIVHSIITKHGGRIWADSHKNEGATFYFTLNDSSSSQLRVA